MSGVVVALLAAAILNQSAETASAVCETPQVPAVVRPVKPARPAVPSCVDEARARHNCRANVITTYNRQMEAYSKTFETYVADLGAYVDALNRYILAVNVYTACERKAAGAEGLITG